MTREERIAAAAVRDPNTVEGLEREAKWLRRVAWKRRLKRGAEAVGMVAGALMLLFMTWMLAVGVLTALGILALFPFVDFGGDTRHGVNLNPVDVVAPYAAWAVSIWMGVCGVAALVDTLVKGKAR